MISERLLQFLQSATTLPNATLFPSPPLLFHYTELKTDPPKSRPLDLLTNKIFMCLFPNHLLAASSGVTSQQGRFLLHLPSRIHGLLLTFLHQSQLPFRALFWEQVGHVLVFLLLGGKLWVMFVFGIHLCPGSLDWHLGSKPSVSQCIVPLGTHTETGSVMRDKHSTALALCISLFAC